MNCFESPCKSLHGHAAEIAPAAPSRAAACSRHGHTCGPSWGKACTKERSPKVAIFMAASKVSTGAKPCNQEALPSALAGCRSCSPAPVALWCPADMPLSGKHTFSFLLSYTSFSQQQIHKPVLRKALCCWFSGFSVRKSCSEPTTNAFTALLFPKSSMASILQASKKPAVRSKVTACSLVLVQITAWLKKFYRTRQFKNTAWMQRVRVRLLSPYFRGPSSVSTKNCDGEKKERGKTYKHIETGLPEAGSPEPIVYCIFSPA